VWYGFGLEAMGGQDLQYLGLKNLAALPGADLLQVQGMPRA
jgi:hypothetical protein